MSNKQNIEVITTGLKCDNSTCDWKDTTIPDKETIFWIDAPCPKCGENLLTQQDYDDHVKVLKMVELVNSLDPEELSELVEGLSLEDINLITSMVTGGNSDEITGLNQELNMSVETHNGIKVTSIKVTDNKTE